MIIQMWHSLLNMPKHDLAWHEQDMLDELQELSEAKSFVNFWSELSDVAYTYSRGHWSGHKGIELPISRFKYILGVAYMYPKYTLRYTFFRSAGKKLNAATKLHEVRNPRKTHKLHTIAENYDLDPKAFQHVCEKQLSYWPLLP